ncbi:Lymphocyte-specific protein 1 [Sciurus carolinensis]|uniref:Lymphocyte-specific protein 1 n=1 Tax=Sciurus carolinensis TaxID=30640 RepID=A0AA41N3Y6_SCICA|nr:Lymphocyte-specific protein 1 [Sciurus carolinensis]
MSRAALLRRNPSTRGLETLCRLTTQWSVEDEEEVARERRRRQRERQLQTQDQEEGGHYPDRPEQEALLGLKPSEAPELDEDEGFGDWSQKPEQQQQQRWVAEGASDGGEPPRTESPEGEQDRRVGLHQASVHLEQLCLSQEGTSPEETVQGHGEVAEEELADRTESLNRSIEKSNAVKKSQPAPRVSKIDGRLEQYTQAIESAGWMPKLSRQTSIELPSMAVSSTKSRWETGEVQTQSLAKTPTCKDIVAGDMSKRSLWEQRGGSRTSSSTKTTPSGKRYKFVATGHGKYEKVLVDEGPAP